MILQCIKGTENFHSQILLVFTYNIGMTDSSIWIKWFEWMFYAFGLDFCSFCQKCFIIFGQNLIIPAIVKCIRKLSSASLNIKMNLSSYNKGHFLLILFAIFIFHRVTLKDMFSTHIPILVTIRNLVLVGFFCSKVKNNMKHDRICLK